MHWICKLSKQLSRAGLVDFEGIKRAFQALIASISAFGPTKLSIRRKL